MLSLTDATRSSVNCAYVRLGKLVGLEKVAETARRMGITTPVRPDLSMPLGTNEVLPIDMAGAYATFAADGMHYQPYLVEEVTDQEGDVLLEGPMEGTQAISADSARLTTEVLEGVVSGGTATAARFGDRRPAAGKTGTTSAYSDAWFVGFVPQLSTAVWMGSPEASVEMTNVGGVRVTGGSYPARIWQAYMGPALADQPGEAFPVPPAAGPAESLRLEGEAPAPRPRDRDGKGSRADGDRQAESRDETSSGDDDATEDRTPVEGGDESEGSNARDDDGDVKPGRDEPDDRPPSTSPTDGGGNQPDDDDDSGGGGGCVPGNPSFPFC